MNSQQNKKDTKNHDTSNSCCKHKFRWFGSFTKKVVVVFVASLLFVAVISFGFYLFCSSDNRLISGHHYYQQGYHLKQDYKNNKYKMSGKRYKFKKDASDNDDQESDDY